MSRRPRRSRTSTRRSGWPTSPTPASSRTSRSQTRKRSRLPSQRRPNCIRPEAKLRTWALMAKPWKAPVNRIPSLSPRWVSQRLASPSRRRSTTSARRRPGARARRARQGPRHAATTRRSPATLLETLGHFGVEAKIVGIVSGPHVSRYELQLAPGHQGQEGHPAQGRPRLRARLDRHPHPGADPRQAGGRRRGPEPAPPPGPPRRHLRRPPAGSLAAGRLARQGHRRQRRLDRPGEDAARAGRRHHRLGQVGLRQRDPLLDPDARLAQRGAAGPGRPEAGRAQPLRERSRTC